MRRQALLLAMMMSSVLASATVPRLTAGPAEHAIADKLPRAFNLHRTEEYAAFFADDVNVFSDHRLVADGKKAWLAQVQDAFKTRCQRVFPKSVGLDYGKVVFFENFADTEPMNGSAIMHQEVDGRQVEIYRTNYTNMCGHGLPRVASYKLNGGKIIRVDFEPLFEWSDRYTKEVF